jgi:hypothetical protein
MRIPDEVVAYSPGLIILRGVAHGFVPGSEAAGEKSNAGIVIALNGIIRHQDLAGADHVDSRVAVAIANEEIVPAVSEAMVRTLSGSESLAPWPYVIHAPQNRLRPQAKSLLRDAFELNANSAQDPNPFESSWLTICGHVTWDDHSGLVPKKIVNGFQPALAFL